MIQNVLSNTLKDQGTPTKYYIAKNGRNNGSAAGSETMTLPTAGNQGSVQGSVTMKYNYISIGISDVALKASKNSAAYLANLLDTEYEGAKEDMTRQVTRQFWADK